MRTALTIAGSDCSGGRGLADMKTMLANGVYAMSAITTLELQNTTGVTGIMDVTPVLKSDRRNLYGYPSGCGEDRNGISQPADRNDRRKIKRISGRKYCSGSGDGGNQWSKTDH